MQDTLKRSVCLSRLVFFVLAAFALSAIANAQAVPSIVVSQTSWLAPFPSGQALSALNGAGTSFGVNSNGDILLDTTSGNQVLLINGQTGAVKVLGTLTAGVSFGVGAVALDPQNNLYVAGLYVPYIAKIPYNNGAYGTITTPTTATPACTGTDTTECLWGGNLQYANNHYWFGVVSMTFDSLGNFYFATNGAGGTGIGPNDANPFSVFQCNAACVAGANSGAKEDVDPPTLLFTEPAPTPSTSCSSAGATVQVTVGGLAPDPFGNLFFTDSALDTCGSVGGAINQSDYSTIKEIPVSAGAPYTVNTLYTMTPPTVESYDDQIDAVAIGNGAVYFATLYDGIFGFANDGTPITPPLGGIYTVWAQNVPGSSTSTLGSKILALDAKGNAYIAAPLPQNGSSTYVDTLGRISIGSVSVPASAVNTSATTPSGSVNIVDNDLICSATPTFTFTASENGAGSTEFSGQAPGACTNALFSGSFFAGTVGAKPAYVGERTAVLTVKDSAGNSGTAIASTIGQGGLVTLDPGNPPAETTGFTAPAGLSVNAAGTLFVADPGAHQVVKVSGTTSSVIGSGFSSPVGTALDANGNLYIADSAANQIDLLSTPGGTPTQSTAVASTVNFAGTPLNSPSGLAIGADGVLYIADSGNNRVVTFNPSNGLTGVRITGLNNPLGIAVDASGNIYVANQGTGGGGSIQVYAGATVTTLTPSGADTPTGIAVEPSGSVLVSDASTGNIVRIPNESGTLNPADAIVIEKNPDSAAGLALDVAGNLYTTDSAGRSIYSIQRTASTITFDTVNDGASSPTISIYAENAGNTALAQATGNTSFLIPPVPAATFVLASGSPVDCATATTVATGTACEFTVQFTPPYGTPTGPVTATGYFSSTALNAASAPIHLSGIAQYVAPPPAAAPTFAPPAGTYTSAQSVTISDTTSGASIYYTTDGTTPSGSSQLYNGAITVSTTETIKAIAVASGYANSPVASATYTLNLPNPGFTLGLAQNSFTLTAGQSASTAVTVTPSNGFNSAVSFSCSGLPNGTSCSFSPATVTPSGGAAATTQLTVAASSSSALLQKDSSPFLPGAALACAICCFFGFRKRRSLQIMLLLAISAIGLGLVSGCGTNINPVTTTVTVNGTSGSVHSSATFTVTVKH